MEHLFTSESIISFFILVILVVVLGIDNVIFVSIIMNRLQKQEDQKKARRIWMITGITSRSLLLLGLGWLLSQPAPSWQLVGGVPEQVYRGAGGHGRAQLLRGPFCVSARQNS